MGQYDDFLPKHRIYLDGVHLEISQMTARKLCIAQAESTAKMRLPLPASLAHLPRFFFFKMGYRAWLWGGSNLVLVKIPPLSPQAWLGGRPLASCWPRSQSALPVKMRSWQMCPFEKIFILQNLTDFQPHSLIWSFSCYPLPSHRSSSGNFSLKRQFLSWWLHSRVG